MTALVQLGPRMARLHTGGGKFSETPHPVGSKKSLLKLLQLPVMLT